MNKYEVMSNGEKIVFECDVFDDAQISIDFFNYDEEGMLDLVASFKDWSYVRKVL
jgi:hypothetical protein